MQSEALTSVWLPLLCLISVAQTRLWLRGGFVLSVVLVLCYRYCGLPGYGLCLCSHPYRNVQSGLAKEVISALRQVVVFGVGHREAIITWLCVLQPGR